MRGILLFAILLFTLVLPATESQAAGTVTQTWTDVTDQIRTVTFTYTGDASAGTVPATTSDNAIDGYICLAEVETGVTQPTALYDVAINITLGTETIDIFGGELGNLTQAGGEQKVPKIGSVYGCRLVSGTVSFALSNNAVASATGSVRLTIVRE